MTTFAHAPATIRIGSKEVSRVGFGAMQLPGPMVWGEPRDPEAARAVLRRVVECGIRLIDTSWYYGPHVANRLIAETLYPYPNDLCWRRSSAARARRTKVGSRRSRRKRCGTVARKTCADCALERCEYVHLRYIETDVPFLESLDAMIAMRAEGKIGHIALSNVTLAQLEQAMARTPIAGVQNLYNVVLGERALAGVPHMVVQDQETIVDLCAAKGMAFLPFFPLALPGAGQPASTALSDIAAHHGASQAQVAIAWLLARSPAMVPIPGTSSVAHLDENWAARELALSAEEIATHHERARVTAASLLVRLLAAREIFLQRPRAAHAAVHRNQRERRARSPATSAATSTPSDVYALSRSERMPTNPGPSPMPMMFSTNNMIDAATARMRSPTRPCVSENTGASQYEPRKFGIAITQNASHGSLVR